MNALTLVQGLLINYYEFLPKYIIILYSY